MTMCLDQDPQNTSVAAGTLGDDDGNLAVLQPVAHIFLKEKASWFEVPDDGAARFQEISGLELVLIATFTELTYLCFKFEEYREWLGT